MKPFTAERCLHWGSPMVHLALLYYYVCTVVAHTVQYDNSYHLVSAFMSQQESATCEDILHFNFLSSFSLMLAVRLSLLPGLFGGKECRPVVTDNGSKLAERRPYAGGEVCQSRLHSHFLLSSNPSSLPEKEIPRQETWATLSLMKTQTHNELHIQVHTLFLFQMISTFIL